jgi:CII-binding regulator of phage lambda lysogenization HflD
LGLNFQRLRITLKPVKMMWAENLYFDAKLRIALLASLRSIILARFVGTTNWSFFRDGLNKNANSLFSEAADLRAHF